MAITDDFTTVGAAGDNFDCDIATGWTVATGANSGNAPGGAAWQNTAAATTNTDTVLGGSLGLRCGNTDTGYRGWYHDITAGSRFKIIEKTLNVWFNYSKGKGANYLTTTSTAVQMRLYFGGTTDYADYRLTSAGNDSLKFGWNLLQCSGKYLNGGSKSSAWTNWDREIHRIIFILDFASSNDSTTADPALLIDEFFVGTKIIVSDGVVGGTPVSFQDVVDYSKLGGTRTGFPLGLVERDEVFAVARCGIDIGNGSDGIGNEGYLTVDSTFVLFNQWSADVPHDLVVKNFSQLDIGVKESVTGANGTFNVAVKGCQLVLPEPFGEVITAGSFTIGNQYEIVTPGTTNFTLIGAADSNSGTRFFATGVGTGTGTAIEVNPAGADFSIEDGGKLLAFDTKFYRWQDVFLGASSDLSSDIELNRVQFDSCETIYYRAQTLNMVDVEIYNNRAAIRDYSALIEVSPDSNSNFLVHDCIEGMRFNKSVTMREYKAQDNTKFKSGVTNLDLSILDGMTVTLINSIFDNTKMARIL